jgi:hypothetical protein
MKVTLNLTGTTKNGSLPGTTMHGMQAFHPSRPAWLTPHRNRKARNAKKRENMAALRAKQQLDSPTVKAARLAAKEKSAREYRER